MSTADVLGFSHIANAKSAFRSDCNGLSEHPYRSCYLAVAIPREVFDPVDRKGFLGFSSLKALRQETKDIIVAIPA
jgi:hypothetical protein